MKIVLNEDGSISKLLREERVGRGQNLSRTIQVEWEEKQSPIDNGIHPDNLTVEINITIPDGRQSGWYPTFKIESECKYYYTMQAWDTVVSGEATVDVRWYDCSLQEGEPSIYNSAQAKFIIDNGVIAQPVSVSSENYNNLMAIIQPLQNQSYKKYNAENIPNTITYALDGFKTAPALYFNFTHDVIDHIPKTLGIERTESEEINSRRGYIMVEKKDNVQTEFFFTEIGKIYVRTITETEVTGFRDLYYEWGDKIADVYETATKFPIESGEGECSVKQKTSDEASKNTASGKGSAAFGRDMTVTGREAFGAGYNSKNHGEKSFQAGRSCENYSLGGFQTGFGNKSGSEEKKGEYTFQAGNNNITEFSNTFQAGSNLKAAANDQAQVGKYNEENVDDLFQVGNGTSTTNRRNALAVKKDGSAEIQMQGKTPKSVVQLGTLDNKILETTKLFDGYIPTSAYQGTSGLTFTVISEEEKTCSVSKGLASEKSEIVIPPFIVYKGINYKVTEIARSGFLNVKAKRIVIPNTIRRINNFAFDYCENLVDIVLPDSVKELGSYSFRGCKSLVEIILPDSIVKIIKETNMNNEFWSRDVFCSCNNLKKVTFGSGISILPFQCFADCKQLEMVIFRGYIETVQNGAFNSSDGAIVTASIYTQYPEDLKQKIDNSGSKHNLTYYNYNKNPELLSNTEVGTVNVGELLSPYQKRKDEGLQTNSKNIVEAINEVKKNVENIKIPTVPETTKVLVDGEYVEEFNADTKQDKLEAGTNISIKDGVISANAPNLTGYQKENDSRLRTESKNIVGAINEVNSKCLYEHPIKITRTFYNGEYGNQPYIYYLNVILASQNRLDTSDFCQRLAGRSFISYRDDNLFNWWKVSSTTVYIYGDPLANVVALDQYLSECTLEYVNEPIEIKE